MLTSTPVPWQAIWWPMVGAALVLGSGRLGPNWLRRILAAAAALASMGALWSLRSGEVVQVEIAWSPLNLFRLSPLLRTDGLAIAGGLAAGAVTATVGLGIRAAKPQGTTWTGLILILLAGCLAMAMAGDFLTLALGSGLVDLALLAMAAAVPAAEGEAHAGRSAWWMAVPGVASTLLLFAAAVRIDAGVGTASLLARQVPPEVPVLAGIAGLLRLTVFPIHPRRLTPQTAATLALANLSGIVLLARVQSLPAGSNLQALTEPGSQPWHLILAGGAVLAGGLMAWLPWLPWRQPPGSQGLRPQEDQGTNDRARSLSGPLWLGYWLHQSGFALAYLVLDTHGGGEGRPFPWPLLAMPAALGLLALWWDATGASQAPPALPSALESLRADQESRQAPSIPVRIGVWLKATATRGRAYAGDRLPSLDRLRVLGRASRMWLVVPLVGLASLAGLPLTAGALVRWSLYASLLHDGRAAWLFVALTADTLLVAGIWMALAAWLRETRPHPLRPNPRGWRGSAALLAGIPLAGLLVAMGIAPGWLPRAVDLGAAGPAPVSVWGLGLVYVLPWLLGVWLARTRVAGRFGSALAFVRRALQLEWIDSPAAWAEERLMGAVYWLGQVGEGEGWWGWALIILSMGTLFLVTR